MDKQSMEAAGAHLAKGMKPARQIAAPELEIYLVGDSIEFYMNGNEVGHISMYALAGEKQHPKFSSNSSKWNEEDVYALSVVYPKIWRTVVACREDGRASIPRDLQHLVKEQK